LILYFSPRTGFFSPSTSSGRATVTQKQELRLLRSTARRQLFFQGHSLPGFRQSSLYTLAIIASTDQHHNGAKSHRGQCKIPHREMQASLLTLDRADKAYEQELSVDMDNSFSWSTAVAATKLRRDLYLPPARPAPAVSVYPEEYRAPYMADDWYEQQGWYRRMRNTLDHVARISRTVLAIDEAQLASTRMGESCNEEDMIRHEKELPVRNTNDLVVDKNGIILGVFLKAGLSLPWSDDKAEELLKIAFEATSTLTEAYPPPMPKTEDQRHIDHVAERKRMDDLGRPHGVWHLGVRR